MNAPDFDAAATFIAANARVIDRRRFERLFGDEGGGSIEVRSIHSSITAPPGRLVLNETATGVAC